MSDKPESSLARLHPGHHWGPFFNDPWSPALDPVVGEVWDRAVRTGQANAKGASPHEDARRDMRPRNPASVASSD
ncbi:MAG: hypothetical protein EXR07_02200 [Acetobacteraceae bacterium]|nr:hypothetical protein [Acetobacteraceae bacterium]